MDNKIVIFLLISIFLSTLVSAIPEVNMNSSSISIKKLPSVDITTTTYLDGNLCYLDQNNVFTGINNFTREVYASNFLYQNGTSCCGNGGSSQEHDPLYSANTYATGMNQGVATTDEPSFSCIKDPDSNAKICFENGGIHEYVE
jgi:hypothetical protein